MKTFDQFWDTLSEDDFAEMASKLNDAARSARENSSDNAFANQLAIMSIYSAKCVLEKYHNWLSEQV